MIILTDEYLYTFFNKAFACLGQKVGDIIRLFTKESMHYLQEKDPVLEINTEYFTISCLIDDLNLCIGIYIFINDSNEAEILNSIISFCKQEYKYSYLLKMRVINNCGIDLLVTNQYVLMSIIKMHTDKISEIP